MSVPYLSSLEAKKEYELLTSPGKIAFYDAADIYCVFYFFPNDSTNVYNLFSLVHFHESQSDYSVSAVNPYPLEHPLTFNFSGTKIKIGLKKIPIDLQTFQTRFYEYLKTNSNSNWNLNGSILNTNPLKFIPKFFVPSNGTYESPLNNILKNNFFNGSYLLEQFDEEKTSLKLFFRDPQELLKVSKEIQKHWPLNLAKMTDRLGNIVYQFPITVFRSNFLNSSDEKSYKCTFSWDSRITSSNRKSFIITVNENRKENLVNAKNSVRLNASPQQVVVDSLIGRPIHFVYDITNKLILAASSVQIIKSINMNLNIQHFEPRIFEIDGKLHKVDVATSRNISIGSSDSKNYVDWSESRIFEEETRTLEKNLICKQYGLRNRTQQSAIEDIRRLINKHAKQSVCIWDPYLNAKDIKNTLFFVENANVECRAISSAKAFRQRGKFEEKNESEFSQWKKKMYDELSGRNSDINNYLLKLKFKCQHGRFGWPFHDRFIIFTVFEGPPKCWSIGTSINSVGKAHHIIQKVSNAKQIEIAFDQLWQDLPDDPCLVWSSDGQ